MNWTDFFRSLASMWPLSQRSNEYPLVLGFQTNPLVLAGSGSGTATIELPGDCDIEIDDWLAWSSDTNYAAYGILNFRTTIYYGSGDWAINYPATNPVRAELVFGASSQRPGRIGYRPWYLNTYGNRGLLSFQVTNTNTTTLTIEVALRGFRRARG